MADKSAQICGALSGSREPGLASRPGPSGFDPARLDRAIILAAQSHKGQTDKGGQPYILHPLRVMVKFADEDDRIVAVLHDVVEDCDVELRLIRHWFGATVADAVDALSRREDETYPDFIERCGQNEIARRVKREDLSDNSDLSRLPTVTKADWSRLEKYSAAFTRLSAIAIEARSGETPSGSTEGESAVIAQKPAQNTDKE